MGMNTSLVRCLILALLAIAIGSAPAQNTTVAYQGRLAVGGGSPDPSTRFDLRFRLFNAASGGSQVGEVFLPNVGTDSNGLFTAMIDFGAAAFPANAMRFLELAVRRAASPDNYTPLMPRQQVVPVPTALAARQADVAGSVTGMISAAQLPANVARLDVAQTFTVRPTFMPSNGPPFIVGITDTVQQLSADLLDGLDSTAFWRRTLNGTTELIGPNENANALNLVLGTERALRLQPGSGGLGSSLIGGSSANTITQTVSGSVIAGGGAALSPNSVGAHGAFVGAGRNNVIKTGADFGVLGGGDSNEIGMNAYDAVIGGGARQMIGLGSIYAGVFGGYNNMVSSNSRFAGVLLGNIGMVRENSDFAAIISGDQNAIGPQAPGATILSGAANKIEYGANYSLIGSGQQNMISTQANFSAVLAGQLNRIQNGAQRSFIGGGNNNEIGPNAYSAVVGGGEGNKIQFNANHAVMLGGQNNLVRSNAGWSAVLGGVGSIAGAPFAIAAGHNAQAEHSGSIVLADGQYANFASSNANEFAVRAAGGVRFVTGGAGLTVDGMKLTSGGGSLLIPAGSVAASNLLNGAALAEILDDDGAGSGLDADRLDGFSSEDFWRLTGNSSTTPGVNFLGTTDNVPLDLRVANRRALRIQPDAPFNCATGGPPISVLSPNLIGGFAGNTIGGTNAGSVIAGGGASVIPCVSGLPLPNVIAANFANINGGQNNIIEGDTSVIGGGIGHRIGPNAISSVIGGGSANQIAASSVVATIAGGRNNYVGISTGGTVGGGHGNRAENQFATVPGGLDARATLHGQLAYAGGNFAAPGDAQTSLYVLRLATADSTPSELFLDGANQRLKLPDNSVWTFDILVVARSDGASGAGYRITGVIKHNALGLTTFIGTPTVTTLGEQIAGWDAAVEADDVNDALVIRVTGASGVNVRWVASVRTVEVIF